MPETFTLAEVYAQLRSAVAESGGQSAFAAAHGLSVGFVSDVMNARRDPSRKILRAIGLRKVDRYMPIQGQL